MNTYNFGLLTKTDGLVMLLGLSVPALLIGCLVVYYVRNIRMQKKDQPIWYGLFLVLIAAILYFATYVY